MVLAVVILKSAILSILLDILKMRGRESYRGESYRVST